MDFSKLRLRREVRLPVIDFRAYGFGEFASIIYPNTCKKQASRNLRNLIKGSEKLYSELIDIGYKPTTRTLLPVHIEKILTFIA